MSNLQVYNIATINVKTQGKNFRRKNLFKGERNVRILAEFIRENELNFVGTQELTYRHQNALAQELGTDYIVTGEYRFGNGPILERIPFNESNAIITSESLVSQGTEVLPWIPTLKDAWNTGLATFTKFQPRIYTVVSNDDIIHINTHLHDSFAEKREEQEQYLVEYIAHVCQMEQAKSYYGQTNKRGIILTGDFNDHLKSPIFPKFMEQMASLGFSRIPVDTKTYSKQPENVAIDHIFISKGLSLEDFKVCDTGDITTTTDHYPVIAKVKKK